MNLLPKNPADFGKEKFWDEFFYGLRSQPFEWYGEYENLCDILDKYIKLQDKLLVIGCGNSKLSPDLYDVGFLHITNIDISSTVIQQMKHNYSKKCPSMVFERMDMFEMSFQNETFNVVLDKGTLDAIMVDDSADCIDKVNKMFLEISRVLKFGGRYICISLLQEHILVKILNWFVTEGWMIRVNRCHQAEQNQVKSYSFPVFLVVCTKMKKLANLPKVLEIATDAANTVIRVKSEEEMIENVKSAQYFAIMKHSLSKRKLKDDNVSVDLCCAKSGKVKYRLYIVDSEKTALLKYAIFIVPQGRETEWMFATDEGRQECAQSANCERLVIVHLLRDFQHSDMEEVKKDLSANVMDLAPANLKSQVPFLSVGEDIGHRKILIRDESLYSGSFVVEDVKLSDGALHRQLIFLNKPYLIQSEAQLKKVKSRRKNENVFKVDFDYLACEHHSTMIAGFTFLQSSMTSPKILLVGLGGGGLAMYLKTHFPSANIEAVELDNVIVGVAERWFAFKTDERLSVHIENGLQYMEQKAHEGAHYDAIIIDVDNKDTSAGLSCPPQEFVSSSMLATMSQLVDKSGILLLNFVCRDTAITTDVCHRIKSEFASVFQRKIPSEVNTVMFCTNNSVVVTDAKTRAIQLSEHIKKFSKSNWNPDVKDIIGHIKHVTIND